MRQEKSRAIVIPFIGGKDVMPITGYFGPYPHDYEGFPDYFTDDIFKKIADAGINLIVRSAADYHTQPELVEKTLSLGEKYGVGIFVSDNSIVEGEGAQTITAEVAAKKMENYIDRKALCGMYVTDEPTATYYCDPDGSRLISKYERASKVLQQDLDQLCYSNLLPVYNFEPETRSNYERYVNEFCDTLQPKVISWDMYPFDKHREGKMEVYFYNMDVIRKAADERNLPFWAFIQAGAQWNDGWNEFEVTTPYFPNEEQFHWNVNTSLAFGAQGIQYFPLVQPYQFTLTKDGDYECNGIIGAMGTAVLQVPRTSRRILHMMAKNRQIIWRLCSVHSATCRNGSVCIGGNGTVHRPEQFIREILPETAVFQSQENQLLMYLKTGVIN